MDPPAVEESFRRSRQSSFHCQRDRDEDRRRTHYEEHGSPHERPAFDGRANPVAFSVRPKCVGLAVVVDCIATGASCDVVVGELEVWRGGFRFDDVPAVGAGSVEVGAAGLGEVLVVDAKFVVPVDVGGVVDGVPAERVIGVVGIYRVGILGVRLGRYQPHEG